MRAPEARRADLSGPVPRDVEVEQRAGAGRPARVQAERERRAPRAATRAQVGLRRARSWRRRDAAQRPLARGGDRARVERVLAEVEPVVDAADDQVGPARQHARARSGARRRRSRRACRRARRRPRSTCRSAQRAVQAQRVAGRALLGLGREDDDVGHARERVAHRADARARVPVVVRQQHQRVASDARPYRRTMLGAWRRARLACAATRAPGARRRSLPRVARRIAASAPVARPWTTRERTTSSKMLHGVAVADPVPLARGQRLRRGARVGRGADRARRARVLDALPGASALRARARSCCRSATSARRRRAPTATGARRYFHVRREGDAGAADRSTSATAVRGADRVLIDPAAAVGRRHDRARLVVAVARRRLASPGA